MNKVMAASNRIVKMGKEKLKRDEMIKKEMDIIKEQRMAGKKKGRKPGGCFNR